jgi:aarF domain-containing kinase
MGSKIDEPPKTAEQLQLEAQRELKAKLKTFLLNVELIPKELLFVGRAMRIVQANNQAMGALTPFCGSSCLSLTTCTKLTLD